MRKAPLLLGLSVALTFSMSLAGDALAKPKKTKKPKPPADTAAYFMASDPHVPLAITDKGKFVPFEVPKKQCGDPKRWATVGSAWQALDAWGQVAGDFTIDSVEHYDVTGCDEVAMKKKSGDDGAKLFVSSTTWKSPASVELAASDAEKSALGALLDGAVKLYATAPKTLQQGKDAFKIAYFTAPNPVDDGTHPIETWAVASGPMLVFAHVVAGEWKLAHVSPPWDRDYSVDRYRLVSVFDMDGDGSPEVIVNENNLDSWNEEVFSLVEPSGWSVVVVSPGGSTA